MKTSDAGSTPAARAAAERAIETELALFLAENRHRFGQHPNASRDLSRRLRRHGVERTPGGEFRPSIGGSLEDHVERLRLHDPDSAHLFPEGFVPTETAPAAKEAKPPKAVATMSPTQKLEWANGERAAKAANEKDAEQ